MRSASVPDSSKYKREIEEGNPHKLTLSGKVTPKAEICETDDVFLSTLKGMRRVTGFRCWQYRYGYVPPVHLSHGGASFTQEHDFMILQSSSSNVCEIVRSLLETRTPLLRLGFQGSGFGV